MTNIDSISEKWRAEGFDCTFWEDAPERVWADLVDPRDERVLILAGVLEVQTEGHAPVVLRAGEEIFIPAHVRHGSRVLSQEPVQLLFGYRIGEKETHADERAKNGV